MVYLHNVCIDKFVFVIVIVFDFNSFPTFNDTFTCPSKKTNFNWAIATDNDLTDYKYLTRIYCKDIHVDDVVKCSDVNCKSHDHLKQIVGSERAFAIPILKLFLNAVFWHC